MIIIASFTMLWVKHQSIKHSPQEGFNFAKTVSTSVGMIPGQRFPISEIIRLSGMVKHQVEALVKT